MRILLTLLVAFGLTACSSSAATGSSAAMPESDLPASSATSGSPASAAPVLSPDGKRFAKETHYQGECAPAGSRGGCYSFTFYPDGKAEHVLLDATDHGTYRIEGNAVIFRSGLPEAQENKYASADGFRTLGAEYHYVP